MRAWCLVLLVACASTPAPVTQPPQERDVLAEVVATLRAGECEAAARDDVDARFRHWAPDAELHLRRELDGELVSRVWSKDEAREVLLPPREASRSTAPPECSFVEDLEPRLQRLRETDIEPLVQRLVAAPTPRDRHAILSSLVPPVVWISIVGHEIVDGTRVIVRYRVFERRISEVLDAEATYVERGGEWLLMRLTRARTETVAPVRAPERCDDVYYASMDAAVDRARASGDARCEIEALVVANRGPEAFELLMRASDPLEDLVLALRAARAAGRLNELTLPTTEASPEEERALLLPAPRVCAATYDPSLGRASGASMVAAFRTCSPEDEAKLSDARRGRGTLGPSDFCAPSPSRLRAFFDALFSSLVACRSDRTSGSETVTFSVSEEGVLRRVSGDEPDRMRRCLDAALAASPFPPFRIRPPQGPDDGIDGDRPFFALGERVFRLEREMELDSPAWEVSWEVTFGSSPSYRVAPL